MLSVSNTGLHLIAGFEGWSPDWYYDQIGRVYTIGFGHTGPLPAGIQAPLTIDAGYRLLRDDAATAQAAVNRGVKVLLGTEIAHAQARFDCLVCLTFNIGTAAFLGSSLLREINAKPAPRDWSGCGPLWLEWDHSNGIIVQGLLNRRRLEFADFLAGRISPPKV